MNAPGPWIVDGDEIVSLDHGKHYTVAIVQNDLFTVEANRANRDLIAAAPDLLAALELIANSEEHHGETIVCDFDTLQSVARAAIAKANRGQS